MKNKILITILLVIYAYLGITYLVWSARNPMANNTTFYTHFLDAVRYKKLDKFN